MLKTHFAGLLVVVAACGLLSAAPSSAPETTDSPLRFLSLLQRGSATVKPTVEATADPPFGDFLKNSQLLLDLFSSTPSALIFSGDAVPSTTNNPPGYYRLEVLFTYFDNKDGRLYNGKTCDYFSKCDPIITGYIDINDPDGPHPGHAGNRSNYHFLVHESNKNTFTMNSKLSTDFCSPTVFDGHKVNVRVLVEDKDYLTANDLIDEFDCRFIFTPNPGSPLELESTNLWAPAAACRAIYRPNQISLSYRWRAYTISPTICGQN